MTRARPTAVLPEDESTMTLPRASAPVRSPSITIEYAARSLTDPPGLNHSHFAQISTPSDTPAIGTRTRGVRPMVSSTEETTGAGASFFERYTPHDGTVSPKVHALRAAFKGNEVIDDEWLEEKLRELLASMLRTQGVIRRETDDLPAVRASTREELWRRVNRARDFLHAHLGSPIRLSEMAAAACLSPFHLLRTFQAAFRQTPHQYLNQCRLERAKFLLEKTRIPVTSICLDCGFTSLGSFSALFHKSCGMSPRAWRASRGVVVEENSKIREVYLTGPR